MNEVDRGFIAPTLATDRCERLKEAAAPIVTSTVTRNRIHHTPSTSGRLNPAYTGLRTVARLLPAHSHPMRLAILSLVLGSVAACTPRALPLPAGHPARADAPVGRLAGPPAALRPGVTDDVPSDDGDAGHDDHGGHGGHEPPDEPPKEHEGHGGHTP